MMEIAPLVATELLPFQHNLKKNFPGGRVRLVSAFKGATVHRMGTTWVWTLHGH